jgi:transposase
MQPEVRMARYVEALERYRCGRLSCVEAAELLGISERHFRRLRERYAAEGAEGLIDRRRGRASGRRAPVDRVEFVVEQYRTRYWDFTVKHFHEALRAEHGFALGYTWTKAVLQSRGLVAIAPRRAAHRKKRPRRPLPGMMLFQDGSTHEWLVGQAPLDLIVTLDDATSAIYSIFLVEEEGTLSSFRGLEEVISQHGLFSSLYTDRGSHYFTTPKAGAAVDRQHPTQVGRALAELRIEHIASYSPEARGRMERVFGTLQQRLPPLLRLHGITTIAAANRYLADTYRPEHNTRFAVAAAEQGSAFVPFATSLRDILCIKQDRVVGRDNCVRCAGRILQIPEQRHRHHFVKATVQLHEYPDGSMALFHGPRRLAGYTANGSLIQEDSPTKSAA